jgi:RHS repeat-associated protein
VNESYSWDANGNPTGSGYVIGPDNELLSDGAYNYSYDADGNCTSRTDIATGAETLYAWDARNRLVGVTDETSTGQITQTVTYAYDVENRWIGETVTAYSGGSPTSVHTTDFAYDGNQIVLQLDAASPLPPGDGQGEGALPLTAANLSHRYLDGPAVDQVLADEQVTLQNGALATDEVLYPLADAQGTVQDVVKLTGTAAAVVDHIIYNGFGGVTSESDPSQGVLFKYTGRATDSATDIEFHDRRVKITGSPDWLSVDPIGETSGTTNLYDYCGNSPTNFADPSGMFWGEVGGFCKGLGQGVLNIANGVQDMAIGLANTPAMAVNGIAWTEEKAGILNPNQTLRAPYIPSPDWSRGMVTQEGGEGWADTHNWSKFAGATGVTAAVSAAKLAQAARAASEVSEAAETVSGAGEAADLTAQQERAVQSLQQQITEHQQKLAEYIKNPDAFDNQGFLENAPTPEIRQSIIDGRIRHLQNEIRAFEDGIKKITGG